MDRKLNGVNRRQLLGAIGSGVGGLGLSGITGATVGEEIRTLRSLVGEESTSRSDATFEEVLANYSEYDRTGDGIDDIERLERLPFEDESEPDETDGRFVVVLVESRLLAEHPDGEFTREDLLERLERYRRDLEIDGFVPRFVEASVYAGEEHRDGETVLAIREFFRELYRAFPNFVGAVLVGSFPEASLVRRWIWRKDDQDVTIDGRDYRNVDYLRIVPEGISSRADVVLADLTGHWEEIYEPGPKALESIEAIPDENVQSGWPHDGTFTSSAFELSTKTFEDFFWIRDDEYTRRSASSADELRLELSTEQRRPEVSEGDSYAPNPIAMPTITVSRINPRQIAVDPDDEFRDENGNGFLNADGKPRTVETDRAIDVQALTRRRDPTLERELLVDYFDRNHAFRSGEFADLPFRPGAIGHDFSGEALADYLEDASAEFEEPLTVDDATLLEYVEWLSDPAVFRGIYAHSSPWNTTFGDRYDVEDLEDAVGGRPWRWEQTSSGGRFTYEPSFESQGGHADLYLHRTLWENGVLDGTGANLFVHIGCSINTAGGGFDRPYNDPTYGTFQNGEGVLFYLNGLALMARAKVFYDKPRGFPDAVGRSATATFGDGWREYFRIESRDRDLRSNVSGNKRTYHWSVLGDWTLRLRYGAEDCLPFDPDDVRIRHEGDRWYLVDGRMRLLAFDTEGEAERAAEIVTHYGMNSQCFVGRPNSSFSYYLVDGAAPVGLRSGEDCRRFDPNALEIRERDGDWKLIDDGRVLLSFPNEREAVQARRRIRKYGFTQLCFVGRPDPSMMYLKADVELPVFDEPELRDPEDWELDLPEFDEPEIDGEDLEAVEPGDDELEIESEEFDGPVRYEERFDETASEDVELEESRIEDTFESVDLE